MLLAVDVYYIEDRAKAVGVLFNWDDEQPHQIITEYFTGIEEYIPGEFYRRELPCILKLLKQVDLNILEGVIVDGYVYVSNQGDFGLGGKLYEALNKQVPIIGVAKTSFMANKETVVEIHRGESNNPLHVSAIGTDIDEAAQNIKTMKGPYRMPAILKLMDTETKKE
ncbi:endonuclease V [Mucilaginibacter celer]|uniref:Endonuclease V n=1 Tax=Mucilaginibacter celer TaxID=2305508 RepID=A0A494VIH5_9SPHI|nr:endonuclease V [Mucilaginibacter celer]AYL94657.1 endonuclease V [Mucilaginibacter celer]